jgi:mono/diheme cytochrome c family protein
VLPARVAFVRALLCVAVTALAAFGAAAGLGLIAFARAGVSARTEPAALEVWAARSARDLLIPAAVRSRANPIEPSGATLARAKEHWGDHCAICHGRDGRGDTEIGRGLHPRAPDLTRAETQRLADGQLFWIIENGVKLTGMPAWGDESPEDDAHAWGLVHWIRRLPELAPEEIDAMQAPAHHREHTH